MFFAKPLHTPKSESIMDILLLSICFLCSGFRELRIGSVSEMTLEINVTNLASDAAYRSRVFITYTEDLGYIGPRLEDQA